MNSERPKMPMLLRNIFREHYKCLSLVCCLFFFPIFLHASNASNQYVDIARAWLSDSCGIKCTDISIIKQSQNCVLVGNKRKYFVVLANSSFSDLLSNPVLAYGDNSYSDNATKMMSYYDVQLRKLRNDSIFSQPGRSGEVAPLLKRFSLWQANVDLSMIGLEGVYWGGCVPTSVLMILYYHKWPEVMHGSYRTFVNTKLGNDTNTLADSKESTIKLNVEGTKFEWPSDLSEYDEKKRPKVPSMLWAINGLLCDVSFGKEGSSGNHFYCLRALVCNYGYTRRMVYDYTCDKNELVAHVRSEIDAGRPLLMSHFDHAFVCDGYKGDFLHFNMGWGGSMNGYYRILSDERKEGDAWWFLSGIEPDTIADYTERQINLSKPGTLKDCISVTDFSRLKKLTLSGTINTDDIDVICKLSGRNDFRVPFEQRGTLAELDISNATIMAGSRKNKNTSTITRQLFAGCKFSKIVLPDNTDEIHSDAFSNCKLLEEFVVPQSVEYVSNACFAGCDMLYEVRVPEKLQLLENYFCNTNKFCKVTSY